MTQGRGPANNTTCASCQEFPIKKAEGTGVAECRSWDKPMAFDDPACVLHVRAKDFQQRRGLVRQLIELKTAKGNTP